MTEAKSNPLPLGEAKSSLIGDSGERVQDIAWSEAAPVLGSGFAMGSADVVPGVSGGTMAVACGIYEQLLAAIASINPLSIRAALKLDFSEVLRIVHYRFLVSLALGLFAAIVVMIKIVRLPELLLSHPTLVYSVFFGLVAASIFVLGKKVKWTGPQVLALVVGTAFGFAVVNMVPRDMPGSPFFMYLYGVIAISAMLLPGISGSFILLILGQYERVIGALKSLLHLEWGALAIVVPFSLGCLTGIVVFSRLVSWMLRKFHDPVMAGLCGLLLGSLWRIWPYQVTITRVVHEKIKVIKATPVLPESWQMTPLLLLVLGFALVFFIEFLAKKRSLALSSSSIRPGN